jgi:hypothetical protein
MIPKNLILFSAILLAINAMAQYQLKDNKEYGLAKISTAFFTAADSSGTDFYNNKNRDNFWFTLGLGGSNRGIAMGLGGSYLTKKMIFSARIVGNQEIEIFGSEPTPSVVDIALLAGYMSKLGRGYSSISTGISFVKVIEKGDPKPGTGGGGFFSFPDYYNEYSQAFGVPFEIQVFATPFSFMGVGIYIFGNINSKKSFAGALFGLQFGRFK